MDQELRKKTQDKMDGALDALKKEFATIRTGRASTALVDHITVEVYGTPTKLVQAATLSLPDARTILIQPWDPKNLPAIEKAIMKSDLGVTPINDGKVIRISMPPLTEERRKEFVKLLHKRAEEGKVAMRNVRRDINEALKKKEKDKTINEDDLKKSLDEVQKITDLHIKKVDELVKHKETEIMEV